MPHTESYHTFSQKISEYAPTQLAEFKNIGDITTLFTINRLFQVFSTTPNKTLEEQLNKTASYTNFPHLRNAIMHGTYFKDLDANIYIYDAPNKHKTEEELKFVDKFDCNNLAKLTDTFFIAKKLKVEECSSDTPLA